jgi:glycosyltransferase involved in cell wall biosynthesis
MKVPNSPIISIITVVMDDFEGFRVTAKSLLSQRNSEFEWIIVDSSKSDEIAQFLLRDEFSGLSTSYFKQVPRGIYSAMNTGWQKANGLFVWYINAGDYFSSTQSTEIARGKLDSATSALAFPVLHVTHNGFVYSITSPEVHEISPLESYAIMNHQGVLVRKEVIEISGGFDETLKYAADGKFLDYVSQNFEIKICKDAIVAFVYGGASSLNHKKVWEEIKTYRVATISPIQIFMRSIKTKIRANIFNYREESQRAKLVRAFLRKRLKKIKKNSLGTNFYMDNINSSK